MPKVQQIDSARLALALKHRNVVPQESNPWKEAPSHFFSIMGAAAVLCFVFLVYLFVGRARPE